jgi:hypothetical protein
VKDHYANELYELQGSKPTEPLRADSVEVQVTSAGEDAVDSSEDNGRSAFPVIKFHASSSIPSPLPLLPPLPSTSLSLPLPQLQVPPQFRSLSQPPRIPGEFQCLVLQTKGR